MYHSVHFSINLAFFRKNVGDLANYGDCKVAGKDNKAHVCKDDSQAALQKAAAAEEDAPLFPLRKTAGKKP